MSATASPQILALIRAWEAAVVAHDIDAVLAHHADDLLMFDVVGPERLQGIEAYRQSWNDQFFPWHAGPQRRFELRDIDVRAGDTAAFATALLDCAGMESGKPVAFTLRLTLGFEKRGGEWTVVHEHHSQPLPVPGELG
jgi:ketosteroid isomerase-like protein